MPHDNQQQDITCTPTPPLLFNEVRSLTWVMSCMFQGYVIEMFVNLFHIQFSSFRTTTLQNPESHLCKVTCMTACSLWSPKKVT